MRRKRSIRLRHARGSDDDPLNKWHRCLSSEERDAMTAAFKFVDVDGNGALDPSEFRAFMRILRLDVSGAHGPLPCCLLDRTAGDRRLSLIILAGMLRTAAKEAMAIMRSALPSRAL